MVKVHLHVKGGGRGGGGEDTVLASRTLKPTVLPEISQFQDAHLLKLIFFFFDWHKKIPVSCVPYTL